MGQNYGGWMSTIWLLQSIAAFPVTAQSRCCGLFACCLTRDILGLRSWRVSELKKKIQNVLDQVVGVISQWKGTDTLTLMQNEHDLYDPYFFISFDVYNTGDIPEVAERIEAFSFAGAFETLNRKDRFLVNELPVRLEYKDIKRFDDIIDNSISSSIPIRDSGTYMFYRVMTAKVMYAHSDWLERARERLSALKDSFWEELRKSAQARMEHYLGDLAAAAMVEDELFFMISASGFITSACGTLLALNHEFEPPPRQLYKHTLELERKPDTFQGLLESFLRHKDTSFARKREIAELLAKRIIQL